MPVRLLVVCAIGLATRLVAAGFSGTSFDFTRYRLPIAQCIAGGKTLYCDCAYNHTPLYPYAQGSWGPPQASLILPDDHDWVAVQVPDPPPGGPTPLSHAPPSGAP